METILLESSLRVMLMAAGVGCVLVALRIRDAAAQHQTWTVVLAAMLLTPMWSAYGPKISAPLLPTVHNGWIPELRIPIEIPNARGASVVESPKAESTAASAGVARSLVQPKRPWNWGRVLLVVYLIGFGVMFIRLLWGTLRAGRIVKEALSDELALVSRDCAVPVTIGWIRPKLILPASWRNWSAEKLDAVLTHEREHIRRRDPLLQWLALLNRAIFWFHPIAWWLERKLSVLREQACDDEVIRQGHSPHLYAEILIELARTVEASGGRLRGAESSIEGGELRGRIERLLEGPPLPGHSKWRIAAAGTLCFLLIAVFVSCRLERKSGLAPGQLTMNEMMHQRAAGYQKSNADREEFNNRIAALTPEEARSLEAELKAKPQDEKTHMTLVRYYQRTVDLPRLNALALWYIEHAPDQGCMQKINAAWDRPGFERGKKLWMANLRKPDANASMYRNAARYLVGGDKSLAELVLLEGQQKYPDEKWAYDFGVHYAHTLLGGVGPTTEENVIRELSMTEAHGAYAKNVRAKLAVSNDADILRQTAQWLVNWSSHFLFSKEASFDFDVLTLADSYYDRANSIQPYPEHMADWKLQLATMKRMTRIRKTPMDQLDESDRMWMLCNQVERVTYGLKIDGAESKAKELLAMAERNPNDADRGTSIFYANLALTAELLRRGKKQEAVRYLLAASDAPPTDRLRHGDILMNTPRELVDWGEREAVAKFLERCAQFNKNGKNMAEWAAQIRKGINPQLIPYSN
jgi:beta-lactamase regulating signal transducer with metallopeptidase domain